MKNKSENKTSGRKSELKSNNHRLAVKTYLAEERERMRIASKIHDGIGQNLVLCNIHLTKVILSSNSDELTQKLQEIKAIIKDTLSKARDIVFEISPPSLVQIGLEPTLKELTSRFGAKHNLYAVFETDGQVYEMDADLQILLFQMVKELLVNISKHANAHNVRVSSLKKDNTILIVVEDDGVGFDVRVLNQKRNKGIGISGIQERVSQIEGSLEIESIKGKGTRVSLEVPLKLKIDC